jgi:hypothetical protein
MNFALVIGMSVVCMVMIVTPPARVDAFIPAKLMDFLVEKIDDKSKLDFGQVSETLTHETIITYGVIRSIARFFANQTSNSTNMNLSKLDTDYQDVQNVYRDYYGASLCNLPVEANIKIDLQPNVAIVDFDPNTKDLPNAHFDAEQFAVSNKRVMDMTNQIYDYLNVKDYQTARILTGQVLHTIQDFYSHSNWVEMGNRQINTLIGTSDFSTLKIVNQTDNVTCYDNCTRFESGCGIVSTLLIGFVNLLPISKPPGLQCPLVYYKCSQNIAVLDKLVSGFYSNQKLSDGTPIGKPANAMKCGHGGFLDNDEFKEAFGGINKDSGMRMIFFCCCKVEFLIHSVVIHL